MAAQASHTVGSNGLAMLLYETSGIVRVAADAAYGARRRSRYMAVRAASGSVDAKRDRESEVVVRRGHREGARRAARHPRAEPGCRYPRDDPMTQAAVARQGCRRGCARMSGKDSGATIVLLVAGKARDRRVRPSLLARSTVALRAIGEHVHAGQGESGETVELDGPSQLPAGGRVTSSWQLAHARLIARVAL